MSIPGDAVHFTSFAPGERPHGTVQLGSREVDMLRYLGYRRSAERERKVEKEREETPTIVHFPGGKKKRRNST